MAVALSSNTYYQCILPRSRRQKRRKKRPGCWFRCLRSASAFDLVWFGAKCVQTNLMAWHPVKDSELEPGRRLLCLVRDATVRSGARFAGKAMTTDVVYKIILHSNGREDESLYWSGSREEVITFARIAALKCGADMFRIVDYSGSGAEVFSETAPFRQPTVSSRLN